MEKNPSRFSTPPKCMNFIDKEINLVFNVLAMDFKKSLIKDIQKLIQKWTIHPTQRTQSADDRIHTNGTKRTKKTC